MIFVFKLIWCECSSNYRSIFIGKIADENVMKTRCEPRLTYVCIHNILHTVYVRVLTNSVYAIAIAKVNCCVIIIDMT